MRKLHTEVLIEASPESVWAVLTDFARHGQAGDASCGATRVTVNM